MENCIIWWAVVALWILLELRVSAHILLNKSDSRAAALWLVLVWIPVFGFLLYWAFGVNRVERKARLRNPASGDRVVEETCSVCTEDLPQTLCPLVRIGDQVGGRPLCPGNFVQLLVNGNEAYPAMLEAIRTAKKTIGFCSYIFDDDVQGRAFMNALCAAAKRGVDVRLLVDGIGAWGFGRRLQRELLSAGGRIVSFWKRGRWLKHPGLNLRNHRKILVVDGKIGFTGGINISSRHVSPGVESSQQDGLATIWNVTQSFLSGRKTHPLTKFEEKDAARPLHPISSDLHFLLKGPIVGHLVDAFADDWLLTTSEILEGVDWFPEQTPSGPVTARGITSGPDDQEMWRIYELLLGALRSAHTRVDLMTPYFIPDLAILTALSTASRAGVRVRLWLPYKTDHTFMRWAARAYLPELVECGVEIREISGTFIHSKLAVVDESWVLFGSANLDPRSFRLNFEFNVEAYSVDLAGKVLAYMESFRDESWQIVKSSLQREGQAIRLRNNFFKLFSPFL